MYTATSMSTTFTVDITPNSTAPSPYNTFSEFVAVGILTLILFLFGTIGNSMVLLAVAFSRQLRTKTNVFVMSLAISDLITSTFLLWEAVARFGKDGWLLPNAQWLCGLTAVMVYIGVGGSLTSMAAIAVDRVLLITRPFTYQSIFTAPKITMMLILAWMLPICMVMAPLIGGFGTVGFDSLEYTCQASTVHPDGTHNVSIYTTAQGVWSFLLLLIIAICYVVLYCHVRRHFKRQKRMRRQTETPLSDIPQDVTTNRTSTLSISEGQGVNPDQDVTNISFSATNQVAGDHTEAILLTENRNGTSSLYIVSEDNKSSVNTNQDLPNVNNTNPAPSVQPKGDSSTAKGATTTLSRRAQSFVRRIDRQQLEITKNLFIVVCVYVLCVFAVGVCTLLPDVPNGALIYAQIPIVANAIVNPLIYLRKHPHFRVTLMAMLKCRYRDIPQPSEILLFFLRLRGDGMM